MVSRFEALLQCYQEHCVSRSAVMLHLHNTDALSVQEVGVERRRCVKCLPLVTRLLGMTHCVPVEIHAVGVLMPHGCARASAAARTLHMSPA
jgi:hypothetical protein